MRDRSRRWAWLGVLVIGLILYLLVLRTLIRTQNPNFVPALILLGASVVPLSFLTFAQARTGRWEVPASVLLIAAFFGGVIGTVVAGTLEYDTLRGLGALPMLFVALIEESAKLIVPVVLLFTVMARHTAAAAVRRPDHRGRRRAWASPRWRRWATRSPPCSPRRATSARWRRRCSSAA